MLHGTVPSQCDPAAVPDSLGYAIRAPSVTWRIIARHASRTTLASRRSHEQGRLKQSRLVYKSTISADHPRSSRRSGNKPIPIIQPPTPCTPRGECQRGHFRRLCRAGMAGFRFPGGSQLEGHIPARPPVAARAAGEAAGLDGSEKRYEFKRSPPRQGCNKPSVPLSP